MVQPTKFGKKTLWALVVVIVLVAACAVGFALYHAKPHTNTSVTTATTSSATNVWTGKGNNYTWNQADNWSLGVPKNNQDLEINVASVTQPTDQYGTTSFAFQDNIPNLTIHKLIIDGQVSSIIFNIKGDPLAITDGIADTIVTTDANAAIPQLQIDNVINLKSNATIQTAGKNMLTFYNAGTAFDIGTQTIQFKSTDSSQIDVSGQIKGTGEVYVPTNAIAATSDLSFVTASPDFNGTVVIGSGNSVGVSNQDGSTGGYGAVDAFGNSSITIMNGGTMVVSAAGTNTFTVNNNLTMAGNGVATPGSSTGSYSGAINACVTNAQEGCSLGVSIVLSGKVTLTGTTELGASNGGAEGSGQPPTTTTATYKFNNPVTGNFTLAAVPGSQVVIQK